MKTFRLLTAGLLSLIICISLTACSSDDDGPTEEEQTEEQLQGMMQLYQLKMNLCLLNSEGEPIRALFGSAYTPSNPSERIYYTKSVTTAKNRFKMLFSSKTPCSADGNTYTLANKQGTATFKEENGDKGLLATAKFDVPGLKGIVTKIYFVDGNVDSNNGIDVNGLKPGDLVSHDDKWDQYYMITLGQWKRPEGTQTVLFAPFIRRFTKPTPWYEHALSNIFEYEDNNPILEVMETLTEEEYIRFCNQFLRLLSTEEWINFDGYLTSDDYVTHTYTEWDGKSFFIQCSYLTDRLGLSEHEWDYLLINPNNYANRTKRYRIQNNKLPEEFKKAIPVANYRNLMMFTKVITLE